MKLGSLFDGIGGFMLAGAYHGIEPVCAQDVLGRIVKFMEAEHARR